MSHDSRDHKIAQGFAQLLTAISCNAIDVFRSSDHASGQGIEYGAEWYTHLEKSIQQAYAVVVLVTKRSLIRPWILFESGWAMGNGIPKVIGLLLDTGADSLTGGPLSQVQNCSNDDASIANLVRQLLTVAPDLKPDDDVLASQVRKFREELEQHLEEVTQEASTLAGDWKYEVITANGDLSHSGICQISQQDRILTFDGYRTNERTSPNSAPVHVHRKWYSTWCEVCGDGKIRMCYEIALADAHAKAICNLQIKKTGETEQLDGEYFLLPPFSDSTLNAKHGSISFTRSK